MSARHTFVLATAAMSALACGSSSSPDAGADALDVSIDVAHDGSLDVHDTAADVVRDTGVDAGPLGDALPTHAISFFSGMTCPNGWMPYAAAVGRVPVPVLAGSPSGATRGTPYDSGEDRTHVHPFDLSFTLGGTSFVAASGGNHGVGTTATLPFSGSTAAASSGLPYVQLLACEKTDAPVSHSLPLPSGMMIFYDGAACPTGFTRPTVTQGRIPVALPTGGTPGTTFGGAPFEASQPVFHQHAVSATLTTAAHGLAIASGCCAGGFAANGAYDATTTSGPSDVQVPTVHLLQCQKD